MAVTQDQINSIHEALKAVGVKPGDRSTLARDVNAGMEKIVGLINGASSADKLEYNPAVGYTPEFGKALSKKIETLKSSAIFTGLKNTYDLPLVGTDMARGVLRGIGGVPARMIADPAKFFDLVEKSSETIASLDVAYDDGVLAVAAPTPGSPPPPPPAPEEKPPPPTITESVAFVELALGGNSAMGIQGLVPVLNKQLADASQKTEDALKDMSPMARNLLGFLKGFQDTRILNRRIPEVTKVDGIFDLRSQASLQGLLMVLSDPMVMNIPGGQNWRYTPGVGKHIVENLPELEKKLKSFMSDEDLAKIKPLFEKEKVQKLVDALDHLYVEGLLAKELLIDPNNNPVEVPPYSQRLFQQLLTPAEAGHGQAMKDLGMEGMMDLANTNPDMLRLLDSLTREYTGRMGITELMPELVIPSGILDTDDGSKTSKERLKDFYKAAARVQSQKKDKTADELANNVFILINTVVTLPYGDKEYRRRFNRMAEEAVSAAAAESDPDKAAENFAKKMSEGSAALRADQPGGFPKYKHYFQRDVPTWKPGLQNLQIGSGGATFGAQQIAQVYDDWHLFNARPEYKDKGVSNPIDQHGFVAFKDDDDQVYVMAIDKRSMVFSIEKIDIAALREIEKNSPASETMEQMYEQMRVADPGFNLVFGKGASRIHTGSLENFLELIEPDYAPPLKEFAEGYAKEAAIIRNKAAGIEQADAAKKAKGVTYVSGAESLSANAPKPVRPSSSISRADSLALFRLAGDLFYGPDVIRPGDKNVIALLQRNTNEKLPVGSFLGSKTPVSGVQVDSAATSGKMLAYYNRGGGFNPNSAEIKLIKVPKELSEAEGREGREGCKGYKGRKELRELAANPDNMKFEEGLRALPALLSIVEAQRINTGRGRARLKDEPFTHDDVWALKTALRQVIDKVEYDLRPGAAGIDDKAYRGDQFATQTVSDEFDSATVCGPEVTSTPTPTQNAQNDFDRAARKSCDGSRIQVEGASNAIGSKLSNRLIPLDKPKDDKEVTPGLNAELKPQPE